MMLKLQSRIRDLEKERTELNKELENLKRAGRPRSDTQYSGTFTDLLLLHSTALTSKCSSDQSEDWSNNYVG